MSKTSWSLMLLFSLLACEDRSTSPPEGPTPAPAPEPTGKAQNAPFLYTVRSVERLQQYTSVTIPYKFLFYAALTPKK